MIDLERCREILGATTLATLSDAELESLRSELTLLANCVIEDVLSTGENDSGGLAVHAHPEPNRRHTEPSSKERASHLRARLESR